MRARMHWRGRMYAGLLAVACLSAAGCRHRHVAMALPIPPPQPVPVDTTAKADTQPLVQPIAIRAVPLTPVTVATKKVKKPRRIVPAAIAAVPLPTQVASSPEPNLIGALTPGGSDAPQRQREAQDLISVLERRVNALPQKVKDGLKTQLMQVKNFQRDAQSSLSAGDSEGAMTLATKAKLLLDDLVK